jgi:predicted nucleic acid-binding protein
MSLSWYFEDERPESALEILRHVSEDGAVVPSLWRLEVGNALQAAVRRGRINSSFRNRALEALIALPIVIDDETDRHAWRATLGLAERFDLTLYDAAYLELAHRTRLPLASLDMALLRAANGLGVSVVANCEQ